ncbi:MAG: hypothetical protein ACM3KR_09100 [Deltaproteobacteria bacterium]
MKTRNEISPNLREKFVDPVKNLSEVPPEERHKFVEGLRDKIDAAKDYLGPQNHSNLTRMLLLQAENFAKKEEKQQKQASAKPKRTVIKSDPGLTHA